MTTTLLLQTSSMVAFVAFAGVLATRTVLAERGAPSGARFTRSTLVRRLDLAALALSVLAAGCLVTTVVGGVMGWA